MSRRYFLLALVAGLAFAQVPETLVITILALPGHSFLTESVAASISSAANGDTTTTSRLSARSRRLLAALIAVINAALMFPRLFDSCRPAIVSRTLPPTIRAAESNTTRTS